MYVCTRAPDQFQIKSRTWPLNVDNQSLDKSSGSKCRYILPIRT